MASCPAANWPQQIGGGELAGANCHRPPSLKESLCQFSFCCLVLTGPGSIPGQLFMKPFSPKFWSPLLPLLPRSGGRDAASVAGRKCITRRCAVTPVTLQCGDVRDIRSWHWHQLHRMTEADHTIWRWKFPEDGAPTRVRPKLSKLCSLLVLWN